MRRFRMTNQKKKYKEVYDYLKNNYQTIGETGIMVFDKEEGDVLEPHIRAIRKAFTETGLGWGKDCKFWYKNLYFYDNLPDQYLKQTYIAISPKEGSSVRAKQVKKKEKAKTIEDLKPGESIEIDEADIEFGDEILPSVTQNVTVKKEPKKIPIQTRKEFTQRIKDEKERHYKEFLNTYYNSGIDFIGTTKSYVGSRRPFGEEAEAIHYVFKDKDPEAYNKIVKKHPELKKHDKLLRDPKNFFENFYYLESESEPSEGFLSSESEKESQYDDDYDEYAYDSSTWHGFEEGNPYSDREEEEEEVIEKMPAPEPAPAPASAPAPSYAQKRKNQLLEMRRKNKESAQATAPAPAPPPAPATGSMTLDELNKRKDFAKKDKVLNENPALREAGWELVLSRTKPKHYYRNKYTKKAQFEPPTPPSGGKKTRKKRGKRTKKSKMKKTKKTKRNSRLRGGKRTKKKKSTRKKKRGGVGPSVPPVSRGNQTRRSRVQQGRPLLQGLNQMRNMDLAYIGTAMERLSNPDLVMAIDQEGTLDEVIETVTERITFFINRNQQNIELLREFLDETTEAQQTLDRADSNLGNRYRNFIQQLRALTE